MKKTILLSLILILGVSFSVIANDNSSSTNYIEYQISNQAVETKTGQYPVQVFSKYSSQYYNINTKQLLIGNYSYQLEDGKIRTEFGLAVTEDESLTIDNYLLDLVWQENLNLIVGNHLDLNLSKYLLSTKHDDEIAGLLAQYKVNKLKIQPLYLRLEDDLEGFTSGIEVYGLQSNFRGGEKLYLGASAVQSVPQDLTEAKTETQQNYNFNLEYQALNNLKLETDLAHSTAEKDDYSDQVDANLAVYNLEFEFSPQVKTELSYQDVHELYAPIRATEYKKDYEFKEDDYNRGYQLSVDYQLPDDYKSRLEVEYSDFWRTNSYIQAAPYIQERDGGDILEDDKIKTYQLGLITETEKIYSRLFYTHQRKTNDTNSDFKVDSQELATENEDLEGDYSPGYLDKRTNIIHLYGKYSLVNSANHDLSINGRYVWDRAENKYHNYNSNFGNKIQENTVILGWLYNYQANNNLNWVLDYSLQQRDIDFKSGSSSEINTRGRLHNWGLDLDYQLAKNTSLEFGYQQRIYDLFDYDLTAGDEIYRYYSQDFTSPEFSISLRREF